MHKIKFHAIFRIETKVKDFLNENYLWLEFSIQIPVCQKVDDQRGGAVHKVRYSVLAIFFLFTYIIMVAFSLIMLMNDSSEIYNPSYVLKSCLVRIRNSEFRFLYVKK